MDRSLCILRGMIPMLAVTAAALAPAAAQQADKPEAPASQELSISQPDVSSNPTIQAAALVQPVAPRGVISRLPARLGDLPRVSADGRVQWSGPAGITRVVAIYRQGQRAVELHVVDTAGFPQQGLGIEEILPEGEQRQEGRRLREGLRVRDMPAVLVRPRDGRGATVLQIKVGPRLRLTLREAISEDGSDLVGYAEQLDLGALAELAPAPPPRPVEGDGGP